MVVQGRDEAVLGRGLRDGVGATAGYVDVQRGAAEQKENGDAPEGHEHGRPLDAAGQPGEDALPGGNVAEAGQEGTEAGDAGQQARLQQPFAKVPQQSRYEDERRQNRDQHHRHRADRDGADDGRFEDQQAHRGDGEGQTGVQNRAAGRVDRDADGLQHQLVPFRARVAPADPFYESPEFLPEPADDQQPVVDGEAQPDHGYDVEHRGVDLHQVAEREEGSESPGDRCQRTDQGDPGRQETTEDDEHNQQGDRQRDQFAPLQVGLGDGDQGIHQERGSADFHGGVRLELPDLVGRHAQPVLHLAQQVIAEGTVGCLHLGVQQQSGAVERQERHRRRVQRAVRERRDGEWIGDADHAVDLGQVGRGRGQNQAQVRGGQVDTVEQQGQGLRVCAVVALQQIGSLAGLTVNGGSGAGEALEQALSRHPEQCRRHARCDRHRPDQQSGEPVAGHENTQGAQHGQASSGLWRLPPNYPTVSRVPRRRSR